MDVVRKRRRRGYDVLSEGMTDDELSEEILRNLAQKGFCTLDLGFSEELEANTLKEVAVLDEAGSLKRPPDVLVSGLLGDVGSARILELGQAELRESAFSEVDEKVDYLESVLRSWTFEPLGFDLSSRSPLLLHEAGDVEGEKHNLTEEEGLTWLNWYAYHRLMVIVFVGPTPGVLELKPLLDEDAESFEVSVEPNMCVVLRADCLGHSFQAPSSSYAVSSWFCEHSGLGPGQKRAKGGVFHLGHCRDLEDWLVDRFEVLLKKRDEELKTDYVEPLPRRVEMYLSRFFDRGSNMKTVIRGMAHDFPGYSDRDEFYAGLMAGADVITELSSDRWDKGSYWDEDPAKGLCYSFHFGNTATVHWFDNKMFDLSANEAGGMAPEQRKALELSWTAFVEAGYTRKTLMKSLTGVYIGSPMSEWSLCPAQNGMGADNSSLCGRVSYVFGLMGPTMVLDTEGSSTLSSVYHGMTSLNARPKPMNDMAWVAGDYFSTWAGNWVFKAKLKWLTRMGRCFSYDENADGYCQSEGAGGFFCDMTTEEVDGQEIAKDGNVVATLINGATRNDGRSASMIAPNAPQLQELHYLLSERAGISPLDIDAVDLHGFGKLLCDSVEATATAKALRDENLYTIVDENVLGLAAMSTNNGNAVASHGAMGLLKIIMAMKWGTIHPSQHLRQLNPYIDFDSKPVVHGTELLEIKTDCSFHVVTNHGVGGTNAGILIQGQCEKAAAIAPPRFKMDVSPLLFWPGGGGELPEESLPQRIYTIAGSWNDWATPLHMQWEGDGVYGQTVTIGEQGYELFQIWLDGDSKKILHPVLEWSAEGTAVMGPDEEVESSSSWAIDTRDAAAVQDEEWSGEGDAKTTGKPGERYRVRLHVCGKFRMVDWSKI
mmetsp:Transcript_54923/g.96307  ORF Transcript_54923/g.96307 Transcript_54923/m.96307 type:complete len:882 (-) Transcript_54923:263-2908(-)